MPESASDEIRALGGERELARDTADAVSAEKLALLAHKN